jgi:hypothetical protein
MPTKADFPVSHMDPPVAIALVDQYTSEAESSSTTLAAETQGSNVASTDPMGPTFTALTKLSGVDKALALVDSPAFVIDIVPDDEPPTLTP